MTIASRRLVEIEDERDALQHPVAVVFRGGQVGFEHELRLHRDPLLQRHVQRTSVCDQCITMINAISYPRNTLCWDLSATVMNIAVHQWNWQTTRCDCL